MELINLLKEQQWDQDVDYSEKEIERAMRTKVLKNVRKLYQSYYRGLWLNLGFLIFFVSIYFFNPTIEFLVPVLMIAACFTFISMNLIINLIRNRKVDLSKNVKTVLTEALSLNARIYQLHVRFNSLIITTSFVSGFLLGLAANGWKVQKFAEKPIIFPILLVLTVGFYFFSKSSAFRGFNKKLNPSYYQSKAYLEQQLKTISEDA